MKTLKDAKIGDTVKVVKLHGEGPVKRRIMDMGITKGVEVYIRKVAPLGDAHVHDSALDGAFAVELDDLDGVADFCVFQRFHVLLSLNHDFTGHLFTDRHA